MWRITSLAALLVVATGVLPVTDAGGVLARMAPILLFLVAITVVAELAESAQVFDVAAREAAHLAGGRVVVLFVLVAVLATVTTVLLGLDTTAVLLTPVVLSLGEHLAIPPLPFAMLTVWLANTASLLLPVSNLTNLLALHRLALEPHAFFARMVLPTLAAVAVTVLVVGLWHRRQLRGRYVVPPHAGIADRPLFLAATATCLALVPPLMLGLDPTLVVTVAAVALGGIFAVRRPRALRASLVPWRLTALVLGLAVLVEAFHQHGGGQLVDHLTGHSTGVTGQLRIAAAGALTSNAVNNLPAYLVMERGVSDSPDRLLALLVGTNAGPLVLMWGSLATLLWRERCGARGLRVSPWQFAGLGLVGVPLVLVASTLALAIS
jgi:arsenical pump membrane protein